MIYNNSYNPYPQNQIDYANPSNGGTPVRPAWQTLNDQNGNIQSQYQSTDHFDRSALDQLKTDALRGPDTQSPWRQLMGDQLAYNTNQELSALGGRSQQQASQGLNGIAQRGGGYTTGASERMYENANRNSLLAGQSVRNNAFNQGIGLDIQDEQNRKNDLQNLNQQLFTDAQYQGGIQNQNIDRSIGQVGLQNQDNQNAFNQAIGAYAADRTADSVERAGQARAGGLLGWLGL